MTEEQELRLWNTLQDAMIEAVSYADETGKFRDTAEAIAEPSQFLQILDKAGFEIVLKKDPQ